MPEAVAGYIEGKGLNAVRMIQKDILAGYRKDFSKHAPKKEVPRIEMKNYIDQGWMENLPLYAIEGYLRAEGIPVPEQGE